MSSFGFISSNLEIKFLILYIMARVVEPVPFEAVQEMSMFDGGVDYFGFSECLADLVRTEHLCVEDGLYTITEKAGATVRSVRAACLIRCGWKRSRS